MAEDLALQAGSSRYERLVEAGEDIAIRSWGMSWKVDSRRLCYTQTSHQYALREDYRSLPEALAAPLVDKYLGT